MKKVFNLFLIVICSVIVLNTVGFNKSEAAIKSASINQGYENSDFITVVRTIENGRHYIYIYLDGGTTLICKCEEL